MITRRELMKWSAAGSALAAAAPALASGEAGLDAMLLDTRFPASAVPDTAGLPVWRIAGDVTNVWYEHLDARWRQRGFVLGGITGSDSLFVLEALATHQGRKVVSRTTLDVPRANGIEAVSWIIAPYHPSVCA